MATIQTVYLLCNVANVMSSLLCVGHLGLIAGLAAGSGAGGNARNMPVYSGNSHRVKLVTKPDTAVIPSTGEERVRMR